MTGFNLHQFDTATREGALDQIADWCQSGQIASKEEVLEGFENLPQAMVDTLAGKYHGKVVLRI